MLVLDELGFDPREILLLTAGGYSSDSSGEIARALQATVGANVSVLHVADNLASSQAFLENWVADHDLEEAELLVETGDVETAIENAAAGRIRVVVGASERGLLSRVVGSSLNIPALDDLDMTGLLAERPHVRSLRQRLLGR